MLKIGHFHKRWGFVYMHETTKCVPINNLFSQSHDVACLECFQRATDYPYAIALKTMVIPCRTARQSLKWTKQLCDAT